MSTSRPLWGSLAVLGLLVCLNASAQTPPVDPVEAFVEALDRDLDNLPSISDIGRKETRDAILKHREQVLTDLAKKLTTAAQLSRALRVRDPERFRKPNRNDQGLWDTVDGKIFTNLLDRLYDDMKKAGPPATDRKAQEAFAVVSGDLITNTLGPQRAIYRNAVLNKFLPELDVFSKIPDPGVQTAVARAAANIVLELREDLRDVSPAAKKAYDTIVGIIARIQKSTFKESRRASIEAAGAIIRPLNPDAGEETLNPRGDPPYRIDLLRVLELAPILFDGFKDNDEEARSRAVNTFHRLAALMVKDFNSLILTPALPAPDLSRPLTKVERDLYEKNQEDLLKELNDQIRPRLEKVREQPEVFSRVLRDPNANIRREAMRSLEDLAVLQGFIRDRIIPLPKKDAPMAKDAAVPGMYLEPLFEATAQDVVRGMSDPDERVRIQAAQVLESRRDRARPFADVLVRGLRDPSLFVRWVCARTLGRLGGTPAAGVIEGLAALLCDYDLSVRIAAANALEAIGRPAAAEAALLKVLHHGDPEYRDAVIRALAAVSTNGQTVVPEIARELKHPDPKVRRAAARAIARFGKSAALVVDALKAALQDEDPDVRRFAAEAMLAAEGK